MTAASADAVSIDPAVLVTAAAVIAGHLPIGGIVPRPVDDATDLGADAGAAGWVALRLPTQGGIVVLALAAPLAAALGDGEETVVLADALAGPLAELAAGLGLAASGPVEEIPAAEALTGAITGQSACAAALGADDLDLGVIAVVDRRGAPDTGADLGAVVADMAAAAPTTVPVPSVPGPRVSTEDLAPAGGASVSPRLDLLHAVDMEVTCELGRTTMTLRELLSLRPGGVVELDRAAGSPVDLLVNGTLLARGEVVVVDEEYGVRVTEIVGPDEAP